MQELETVVLTHDIPETSLTAGDIGTIVHRHNATHYEVEFVRGSGDTVAVLALDANAVRPMAREEILHARAFVVR